MKTTLHYVTSPKRIAAFLFGAWVVELCLTLWLLFRLQPGVAESERLKGEEQTVRVLMLTDCCVTTESRHTRNISLPEPLAPFQDMPGFYDHFPSSTFLAPPPQYGGWER